MVDEIRMCVPLMNDNTLKSHTKIIPYYTAQLDTYHDTMTKCLEKQIFLKSQLALKIYKWMFIKLELVENQKYRFRGMKLL